MRHSVILVLFILLASYVRAQDKLFFTNGSTKKGMIVSNAKEVIYFKETDSSQTEKISKSSLIMIEDYKGTRYIFGSSDTKVSGEKRLDSSSSFKRNIFSMQPIGVFFGRVSFQYERISKDKRFGIVIPFALTFNPFNSIYSSSRDSSITEVSGVSYIVGLDVNYYLGKRENFQFFIGPRIRYGTDMFLNGIQGYSLQTQFGWKVGSATGKAVQHISFGFGFVRVISAPSSGLVDSKQSYAWGSINYRVGVKW